MPKYSVEEVIDRGYQIINNIHPLYSQGRPTDPGQRGNTMQSPYHDCSSFMGVINGVGEGGWPPATPLMLSEYTAAGYQGIKYSSITPLEKGDVLFYDRGGGSKGHTVMYIGNGQIMHMTSPTACVRSFYEPAVGWDYILRNPKKGFYPVKWTPAASTKNNN